MRIVRDVKVAQRTKRLKKKVHVIPTPFGVHVGKPDIIRQNRYIYELDTATA
jgi:hypothetical protein